MTFLANIDPSLRDMSFNDVANPTTSNSATSGAAPDGNSESIPGGEPVHRSDFVVLTPNIQKLSHHFQLSPLRILDFHWATSKAFPSSHLQYLLN